jgi:putative ABC transport system substrate-binding protein
MNRRCLCIVVAALYLLPAAPLAGEAQQAGNLRDRVGYLSLGRAAPPSVFVERLRQLGYVDGENVRIDYRFGDGRHDVLDTLARELAVTRPTVIMAVGDEAISAAKKATTTVPIVMLACDALTVGFVTSLSRPGGNVTGVTCVSTELSAKRVGLLKEILPRLSRAGIMLNPANASKPWDAEQTRVAARGVGIVTILQEVVEPPDIERAFAAFVKERAEALIVLDEAFTILNAKQVTDLAVRYHLPTMHAWGEMVAAGGLISYGPSLSEMVRMSAGYVAKILKGAKPADLPVEQPTTFELVINLKTAKALGLTIPPSLLARADEVIK